MNPNIFRIPRSVESKKIPKKMEVSVRRQQMMADRKQYGPSQEGTYKGIKWSASLSESGQYSPRSDPRNTNDRLNSWWCGYIHFDREVTKRDKECMLRECTYRKENTIGFDCCHCDDYPVGCGKDDTYKDFHYVRSMIEATIDAILEKK